MKTITIIAFTLLSFSFLPTLSMDKQTQENCATQRWVLRVISTKTLQDCNETLIKDIRSTLASRCLRLLNAHPTYWVNIRGTQNEIVTLLKDKTWFKKEQLEKDAITQPSLI